MPYPRTKDPIHNLILDTAELEEQAGKLLLKIDENKKKLQKHFDENGTKEIRVDFGGSSKNSVVCKKSERCTIKYDIEKLKQRLDDEVFSEVTKRTYTITDINAMIELMKDAGVKAKDFKALLDVKISPDNSMIRTLYDAGEITMKQLKGTYTATISKTIKIIEENGE